MQNTDWIQKVSIRRSKRLYKKCRVLLKTGQNKRLYNGLKEILHLIEEEFLIVFDDDELANIIQIIKQC